MSPYFHMRDDLAGFRETTYRTMNTINDPDTARLHIAALVQTDAQRADCMLYEVLAQRKKLGWSIRGLVSVPMPGSAQTGKNTTVENLSTGERHVILQNRGADARGCRLDPVALTLAGAELRHAMQGQPPHLVVINRFGSSESEGKGFCLEIIDLVSADIPLLLVVTDRYLDAWRRFIGSCEYELPCDRMALEGWLDSLPRRHHINPPLSKEEVSCKP